MVKDLIPVIVSICLTLLLCEFVIRYELRAWPFERALYVPEHLTSRDTTLRWRFSPSNGRNSLGLRSREIGPKKTGTARILFLGDSLIWTGKTSSDELYTVALERRLNSRSPHGPTSVEVINAGVPGYTTYQELEFLKIYGLDMQPDLVILGFVFNDLYYKYLHKPTPKSLLGYEPTTRLYHFNPYAFPGILFARSYFAHDVVNRSKMLWQRIFKRPLFPFERRGDFYLAWKSYGWIRGQELIGEMQALLKGKGISFAVLVFPVSDQVNDQYRKLDEAYVLYPQSQIRKICDDAAIPRLDLTEVIYRNGGLALFQDYLHLNAKGNDVVTDELEKFLVNQLGL